MLAAIQPSVFRLLSKFKKVTFKAVILPVVLYGCETWFLTLKEEHRFRVIKNKVLRKIFGPKGDEVTGWWRKLHNKKLHDLYSSPSISKVVRLGRMRWVRYVSRMGKGKCVYVIGG
jgi:hypothetical protein